MYSYNLTTSNLHYEKFQDGSVKQIDVPFEIPESWEWVRLNQVTNFGNFQSVKGDEIPDNAWVLDMEDIEKLSGILLKKVRKNRSNVYKSNKYIFNKNTILYGKLRPYLKKVIISDEAGYCTTELFPINVMKEIEVSYFRFILISPYFSELINQSVYGVKMPRVGTDFFKSMLIPIPPLNEQIRIKQRLELAVSKVDDYHELFNTLRQLNNSFPEKLRKSILQYAMQGKLVPQDSTDEPIEVLLEKIRQEKQRLFEKGKLQKKDLQESIIYQDDDNSYYENCPKTWAKVSLATISKITSGGTPKTNITEYYNGEILWLTPADLSKAQSKYYLDISLKSITRLGLENSSAQLVKANSIVYSSRAPIGYINIVPKQYTTNQGCKSLTPYLVIVKWLYFAMKYATTDIKKIASGTTFLEISASKLGDFYIGLPPLREQERIAKKIERLWNKVDSLPFTL